MTTAKPILSTHYYHTNFLVLCETVKAQYGDLLCPEEHALLDTFSTLDFKAQCLYVRLVCRVGPWFRESKLVYDELGAITPILDTLIHHDMVSTSQQLSLAQLSSLFTKSQLQSALGDQLRGNTFPSKADLVDALETLDMASADIQVALTAHDSHRGSKRIISPNGCELVARLQILFFGNRHQSLTEFVLQDLGLFNYFPYAISREHRQFENRAAFEQYLQCAALEDEYRAWLDSGREGSLKPITHALQRLQATHDASRTRWCKFANRLARDLERENEWELALQLYERSDRHPARERRVRILERQGQWSSAAILCDEISHAPWCEDEYESALRIVPRLQKKLGRRVEKRSRDNFLSIDLCLPVSSERVELSCVNALQAQWNNVHYVENQLMNMLFGLAFWDEIFQASPGAFHHAFQAVPGDMYEPRFRARREESIRRRLDCLAKTDIGACLVSSYQRNKGYQCRWTAWHLVPQELVQTSTAIIPNDHLIAIWTRMLEDPRENRKGFPDLIALGDRPGEYALIEVKGPGDTLQESQKRWLRFFARQKIPAHIAKVTWEPSTCDTLAN